MLSSAHSSSKPVLLLLCGLLCDAAIWQLQRAALRDLADVQVVDFAGFDSITQMAAHVLAIAPPQFALAGHSMGGRVALEIVRQAPAPVLRL
ncbi:alpha/beta fold hydrolase, partial [Xanthomonas oryzae]